MGKMSAGVEVGHLTLGWVDMHCAACKKKKKYKNLISADFMVGILWKFTLISANFAPNCRCKLENQSKLLWGIVHNFSERGPY